MGVVDYSLQRGRLFCEFTWEDMADGHRERELLVVLESRGGRARVDCCTADRSIRDRSALLGTSFLSDMVRFVLGLLLHFLSHSSMLALSYE